MNDGYGKLPKFMQPISDGPLYAFRQSLFFAVTLGGVHADTQLRVLDGNGDPIPGLYAAGNTVGRRFGWAYENSHIGLTNALALTHGYVAGKKLRRAIETRARKVGLR